MPSALIVEIKTTGKGIKLSLIKGLKLMCVILLRLEKFGYIA